MGQICNDNFFTPTETKQFWFDRFQASINYFNGIHDKCATVEIFDKDEKMPMIIFTMHEAYLNPLQSLPEGIRKKYKPSMQEALLDFMSSVQQNILENFYNV